jgi:hypothetical protein
VAALSGGSPPRRRPPCLNLFLNPSDETQSDRSAIAVINGLLERWADEIQNASAAGGRYGRGRTGRMFSQPIRPCDAPLPMGEETWCHPPDKAATSQPACRTTRSRCVRTSRPGDMATPSIFPSTTVVGWSSWSNVGPFGFQITLGWPNRSKLGRGQLRLYGSTVVA